MLPREKAVPVINRNPAPCEGVRVTFTPPRSTFPLSEWRGLSSACRLILLLLALHALSGAAAPALTAPPIIIITPNVPSPAPITPYGTVIFTQSPDGSWGPLQIINVVADAGGGEFTSLEPALSVIKPRGAKVPAGLISRSETALVTYNSLSEMLRRRSQFLIQSTVPAGIYRATWTSSAMVLGKLVTTTAYYDITVERTGSDDPIINGSTNGYKKISLRLSHGDIQGIWLPNTNINRPDWLKPPITGTAPDRVILRTRSARIGNGDR